MAVAGSSEVRGCKAVASTNSIRRRGTSVQMRGPSLTPCRSSRRLGELFLTDEPADVGAKLGEPSFEGRGLIADRSVRDNLLIGRVPAPVLRCLHRPRHREATRDPPRLRERQHQRAGTLSKRRAADAGDSTGADAPTVGSRSGLSRSERSRFRRRLAIPSSLPLFSQRRPTLIRRLSCGKRPSPGSDVAAVARKARWTPMRP
jgi:hypothetical protein